MRSAERRPARAEPAPSAAEATRPAAPRAFEALTPEIVLALQRGPGNAAVSRTLMLARTPADELISQHTSWGDVDQVRLGFELLRSASRGRFAFVEQVFDSLGSLDRDDVAYAMSDLATDQQLAALARTAPGRGLLDRMFDELTSGSVDAEEQEQADRILRVKTARTSPADFVRTMHETKVFPFRLPGLTVFSSASIQAERREGGRIWVKQPARVGFTSLYDRETRTLPEEVFTHGIELPEDEIVGVRLYDLGGTIMFRPALILVQLSNETDTTVLTKMAEIAGIALTLGSGSLVGLGVRATMLARVALWADRVATVLGTIATILHEHRGEILARFPRHGRSIVRAIEWVQSATAIYGFARVALEVPLLVSRLRSARIAWQAEARAVQRDLSAAEREAVQSLDDGLTETLDQADAIRAARDTDAVPEGAPTPPEPADVAGSLRLDPDLGEGILAAREIDGHTIKVTRSGLIYRCTDCEDLLVLLDDYPEVFAADTTLVDRLGRVEDLAERARLAHTSGDPAAARIAGQAADEARTLFRDVRRRAGVQRDLAEESMRAGPRPGMRPDAPVPPVPPGRVREGMDSLARFRRQRDLPAAGAANDRSTVARLDIGNESFYGINAHHEPINLRVNAQSRTHAEGGAFQLAAGSLEASRETRGVLFVDRELCRACGHYGAVRSLAQQLGLLHLDVYTPTGLSQPFSFSRAGR
ncbi:MAG TPA: deaminase [Solirubrobacteraceae bacterium]|nr:deaminase [Solirubrobacteraceae bacterium]